MKRVFIKIKEFFCGKKVVTEKKSKVEKTVKPFEFPLSMDDDLETKPNKRRPRKDWQVIDNSTKAHRAFKRQAVQKEVRVIKRNATIDKMSDKEKWMFRYLMKNGTRFISPTEVGRTYGKEVLGKDHYNSGHSRAVLMEFVDLKLATKNEENHYKYLPIN
jgi:hypothetical protein